MAKHKNNGCDHCHSKIGELHPLMGQYALSIIHMFPQCHISCAFRDKLSQNAAYRDGKSKLQYPNSKHNKTDTRGEMCSEAIDLFRLGDDGKAYFDVETYKNIWTYCMHEGMLITWGGTWKTFKDHPHFELKSLK